MTAFIPYSSLPASTHSSFMPGRVCHRRSSLPRTSSAWGTVKCVDLPQNTSTSIDFSNITSQGVGNNLAGLVFTPESEPPVSTRCDVGYSSEQEAAVNGHINVEYTAMYAYHALWAYFDRDVVALPGFAKFFNEQSMEEREHAHEFMQFQNRRGGAVELQPIAVPEMKFTMEDGTSDALYAMDLHLQLEKFVYKKLKALHDVAGTARDPQMQDFVEHYLTHQVEAIKTAADYVSQIKRVGTPHGVYHFDLQLQNDHA